MNIEPYKPFITSKISDGQSYIPFAFSITDFWWTILHTLCLS